MPRGDTLRVDEPPNPVCSQADIVEKQFFFRRVIGLTDLMTTVDRWYYVKEALGAALFRVRQASMLASRWFDFHFDMGIHHRGFSVGQGWQQSVLFVNAGPIRGPEVLAWVGLWRWPWRWI